jgi:glycosyltransferase involved in cell wall biosynthesis
LISVLIPARSRPLELARAVRSLRDAAQSDPAIEILVAIDDDDEPFHRAPFLDRSIRVLTGPRPPTLGVKLNNLAGAARGDILWFLADDYVIDTPGWPARFRAAVATLPGGIGVLYPHDELHEDHASFPLVTRRMMAAVGYFAPVWFPYWFIDTWWDELGILVGRRQRIEVEVSAPEGRGRSHSVFDVAFWAKLFEDTRSLRVRDARILAEIAASAGGPPVEAMLAALPARYADRVAFWESNQTLGPRPERYLAVKAEGERLMAALRTGSF